MEVAENEVVTAVLRESEKGNENCGETTVIDNYKEDNVTNHGALLINNNKATLLEQ